MGGPEACRGHRGEAGGTSQPGRAQGPPGFILHSQRGRGGKDGVPPLWRAGGWGGTEVGALQSAGDRWPWRVWDTSPSCGHSPALVVLLGLPQTALCPQHPPSSPTQPHAGIPRPPAHLWQGHRRDLAGGQASCAQPGQTALTGPPDEVQLPAAQFHSWIPPPISFLPPSPSWALLWGPRLRLHPAPHCIATSLNGAPIP